MGTGNFPGKDKRSTPRAAIPLEVDVEVAGETKKVLLISKDIGAGGMFLRTVDPAPLWKKIKLVIKLPDGERFEVTGEVVRRIDAEQSRKKKHPPGVAVAFDEISRTKRKKLIALVLDRISKRPTKEERTKQAEKHVQQSRPAKQTGLSIKPERSSKSKLAGQAGGVKPTVKAATTSVARTPPDAGAGLVDEDDGNFMSKTDSLLGELDMLLDAVEGEIDAEKSAADDGIADAGIGEDNQIDQIDIKEQTEVTEVDIEIDMLEVDIEMDLDVETPSPVEEPTQKHPDARLRVFLDEYLRNLKGDSHYEILQVDFTANAQQIEAAYQRLLGELRPSGPPESLPDDLVEALSAVLGRVRKAFAILSKPDRRRAYDFLIDDSAEDD